MADWNELHKGREETELNERFAEFSKNCLKPGMRVLDIGCGKGRHAVHCAKRGIEVHGVDSANTAVTHLREKAGREGLFELLKVTEADIKDLPFPDGYFDAAFSVNVLNHGYLADVRNYFKEITRVLRPGGMLFLFESPMELYGETKKPDTEEVEKGTFLRLGVLDKDIPHHLFTEDELTVLLKGFDITTMRKSKYVSPWAKMLLTYIEVIARKK